MTKRLVDIDDEILDEARRALGTTTLKDTVNESLRNTVQVADARSVAGRQVGSGSTGSAAGIRGGLAKGRLGRGQHRAVSVPDLLIAATAETEGLTVLHYDQDFDLIAEITGQPCEWMVPRGSL